jgi:hypothetical protein
MVPHRGSAGAAWSVPLPLASMPRDGALYVVDFGVLPGFLIRFQIRHGYGAIPGFC